MQNLEAKFKLSDLARTRSLAEAAGYQFKADFEQRDTFFKVNRGKLKLREQHDGAWLIYYSRDGREGLEVSNYEIVPVADPARMREVLSDAMGVLARVNKRRTLLMRGNVRLHLDQVEGLGSFGEIEAVVGEDEDPEDYLRVVDQTLRAIDVGRSNLISASYFEMLRPVL